MTRDPWGVYFNILHHKIVVTCDTRCLVNREVFILKILHQSVPIIINDKDRLLAIDPNFDH